MCSTHTCILASRVTCWLLCQSCGTSQLKAICTLTDGQPVFVFRPDFGICHLSVASSCNMCGPLIQVWKTGQSTVVSFSSPCSVYTGREDGAKSCVLCCITRGGRGGGVAILQALTRQTSSTVDGRGSCGRQPSLTWLLTLCAAEMAALGLYTCVCACTAHAANLPCLVCLISW